MRGPDDAEGRRMTTTPDTLESLRLQLARFAAERDWEQFHNPKNLAMALAGEAGEVLEHFQWLTPEQAANLPADARAEVALECADVLLFLLRLCDRLDIDLAQAAQKKLALNAKKYPVEKAKGRATKYDKL
jgi:dCTP diphosphatase